MSESVSAPSSPAAPAPVPDNGPGPVISGPPRDQPAISISEAARLMRQRRTEAAAPSAADGKATVPSQRPTVPSDGKAAMPTPSAADAMARALGVPAGDAVATAPDAGADLSFEIDGTRRTAAELRTALSQAADYTKKTQALAEQARAVEAQQAALAQVLPYLQPELAKLQQAVEGVPRPPSELAHTDPARYQQELARWLDAQGEQQRLAAIQGVQSEAVQRAMAAQVERANEELAREFPQWGDPQQRAAWQNEIVQWATSKGGFSHDELRGLTNAHHLRAMMKAMQFDRMVAGTRTAAPATGAPPVRGAAPPPAPTERVQQAETAFDARPNVRNAAALLSARRAGGNGVARG